MFVIKILKIIFVERYEYNQYIELFNSFSFNYSVNNVGIMKFSNIKICTKTHLFVCYLM